MEWYIYVERDKEWDKEWESDRERERDKEKSRLFAVNYIYEL